MHLKNLKCQYLQFVDVPVAIQIFHVTEYVLLCVFAVSPERNAECGVRLGNATSASQNQGTRLHDRRATGSGQQSTKNGSTHTAGPREAASSFFAPKMTKKNGGPGAT